MAVCCQQVLILPKDRADSRVWVEVTAAGMAYSSRQGEAPRRVEQHAEGGDQEAEAGLPPTQHHQQQQHGGASSSSSVPGPQLVVAAHRGAGSVQVRLVAEQDAELGCVAKVRQGGRHQQAGWSVGLAGCERQGRLKRRFVPPLVVCRVCM